MDANNFLCNNNFLFHKYIIRGKPEKEDLKNKKKLKKKKGKKKVRKGLKDIKYEFRWKFE